MECCCSKENKKTIRNEEEKKKIISRLNKISGQINGIKTMVEDNRYCDDILIQLSAVDSAIKSLANLMIEKHLSTCVIDSIKNGNEDVIKEVIDLFKRFQ